MKRIGDILTRNKTAVVVEDGTSYKQVTIRTNYKGVVLRGTQDGAAILTKNQFVISAGQFILSRIDARNGAFGIVPEELEGAIVTNDFLAFDINEDEVEHEFFNVFLQSPQFLEACIKASRGNTNRKRVNEGFFLNYQVNLPPLADQRKLIKQINKARAQLALARYEITYQRSLLAKLKQAILQEAVQGKLTADWRAAHPDVEPASQLLQKIAKARSKWIAAAKAKGDNEAKTIERKLSKRREFLETKLNGDLPASWEWTTLIESNLLIIDCHNKTAPYEPFGIPIIRTTNVRNGVLDLGNTKYVSEQTYLRWSARCIPLPGDLIFTREAPVGEIGQIPEGAKVCLGQRTMLIRPMPQLVLPAYLVLAIQSPDFMRRASRVKRGAMVGHLRVGDVEAALIPLPPLAEQAVIVERVEALITTCRALEAKIEQSRARAAHLLQAVLKEALSPPVKKEEKIVAFPSGFARQLLAAEILSRHNQHGMTQMKLQKLLHVVEYEARIDEIAGDYQRQAAGPYDNRMMYGISAGLEKQKWFKIWGRGKNATYSPLEKAGQHQKYWVHWESKHPKIDSILNLLGRLKPEQCEIVSTLYAAWNDLLIEAKSPTDEEIIAEASHPNRWHEAKAKIDPAKWPKALGWMREKQLIPTGYGRHTRKLVVIGGNSLDNSQSCLPVRGMVRQKASQ